MVARSDTLSDIALLKVAGFFQPLPLVLTRTNAVKDEIFALGFDEEYQGQFNPKVARGTIMALLGFQADPRQLTVQPRLAPSFAGTAVVNRFGQIIGMILADPEGTTSPNSKEGAPPPFGYALKSDHLINFLRSFPDVKPNLDESKSAKPLGREEILSRDRAATALILIF
jgi:S1-C subfamily serine protease